MYYEIYYFSKYWKPALKKRENMSQTVDDDDDYVAPIVKTKVAHQRRRTSIFTSTSSIKIKRKTTLFGSLPKLESGSRAKLLWEKLKANVV